MKLFLPGKRLRQLADSYHFEFCVSLSAVCGAVPALAAALFRPPARASFPAIAFAKSRAALHTAHRRFNQLINAHFRLAFIGISILPLMACASKDLPPLPPAADMCALYRSYTYAPAAAAVESIDSLRSHVANEAAFQMKCLAPNPTTPGGPR